MKRWKRRFSESFLRVGPAPGSRDETPSPLALEPAKCVPRLGRPASLVIQGSRNVSRRLITCMKLQCSLIASEILN